MKRKLRQFTSGKNLITRQGELKAKAGQIKCRLVTIRSRLEKAQARPAVLKAAKGKWMVAPG